MLIVFCFVGRRERGIYSNLNIEMRDMKVVGLKKDENFQSKIRVDSIDDNAIAGPRAPN